MSSKKIKSYRETKMYVQNGAHEGKIPERIYHEGPSREGRRTQNELSEPGQSVRRACKKASSMRLPNVHQDLKDKVQGNDKQVQYAASVSQR